MPGLQCGRFGMNLPTHADKCENCEKVFVGLSGSTKWCPYCGAKHEGETVPLPAAKRLVRMEQLLWDMRQLPQKRCAEFIADIIDLLDTKTDS